MREPMDILIKKALSARTCESSGSCPSDNEMAAYLEGSLAPSEMKEFESHVSDCASCREILAMSTKLQTPASELLPVIPESSKKTLFHFSIPIPVLGALLIAVVLVAMLFRTMEKHGGQPEGNRIAELRQTASQPSEIRRAAEVQPPAPQRTELRTISRQSAPLMKAVENKAPSTAPAISAASVDETAAMDTRAEALPVPVGNKGKFEEERAKTVASDRPENVAGTASAPVPPPSPAEALLLATPPPPQDTAQQPPVAQNAAQPGIGFAPAVVQETVARPKIYAAQNRIAIAHYSTSPSFVIPLRDAISTLKVPNVAKATEKKKSGGRVFYRNAGVWIDTKCVEHASAQIVEIKPEAQEYKQILKEHPEFGALVPVAVYWEGKNYLLRQ